MAEAADIRDAAAKLVRDLTIAGKTVTTAESCTGGGIAKAITDIAGSSVVFGYGIVSYSNAAKRALLGVSEEVLSEHGAVSERVVVEMAEAALEFSGADLSVAVSGIAGPDGGNDDKPVGTVWFAWARRDGADISSDSDRKCFQGDRDMVRRQSVLHALHGFQDKLST